MYTSKTSVHVAGLFFIFFQYVENYSLSNHTRVRRDDNLDCIEELPFSLPNFKCKNGECISGEKECNGYLDCADGSDETDDCKRIICPSLFFKCSYGACIKSELECDGKFDCRDGSDENSPNCNKEAQSLQCGSNEFRCKSGQCIDFGLKCNGRADCSDFSDEIRATCFDKDCPGTMYKCAYGACAKKGAECNGVIECFDGSDEDPNICHKEVPEAPTQAPPSVAGGCSLPEYPNFGRWSLHGHSGRFYPGQPVALGTVLQVSCDNNYKLQGKNALFCEEGGKWSANVGTCAHVCPARRGTSTLKIKCVFKDYETENCNEAVEGTLAKYECAPFYEDWSLRNRPVHICTDGSWDGSEPKCIPVCGQKSVDPTLLIINGTKVNATDYPWQAAIYTVHDRNLICGGSLLSQKVVLTAAHCVTDVNGKLEPKEKFHVAVGNYYRKFKDSHDKNAQYSDVQKMFIPRQYKGPTQNYLGDIAILITEIRFAFSVRVQPVCLDRGMNHNIPENTNGIVTGFGLTAENSKPPDVLNELTVPSVSVATCHKYLDEDYEKYLTHDKMCAGYKEKGTSVCLGDSGGGLVFKHDGRYYVTGIVSLAPTSDDLVGGCDSNQYGLYTKVAEYINDFILPKLSKYE